MTLYRTKAKCVVCGKITALRQPYGEGTVFLPRRHDVDGFPCDGNIQGAELIDFEIKELNSKDGVGKRLMKIGDSVIFEKSHHAMNQRLKKLVGKTGKIIDFGLSFNENKVLVDFGIMESWWIARNYLKIVEPSKIEKDSK